MAYLQTVAVDGVSITGNGTPADPLVSSVGTLLAPAAPPAPVPALPDWEQPAPLNLEDGWKQLLEAHHFTFLSISLDRMIRFK